MLFAEENEPGGGVRDWICHKLALWPWRHPPTPAFATPTRGRGPQGCPRSFPPLAVSGVSLPFTAQGQPARAIAWLIQTEEFSYRTRKPILFSGSE